MDQLDEKRRQKNASKQVPACICKSDNVPTHLRYPCLVKKSDAGPVSAHEATACGGSSLAPARLSGRLPSCASAKAPPN